MQKQNECLAHISDTLSSLSKILFPVAIILFVFILFYNSIFESHWDEIRIKNISCKEFDIPNCREENDISTIRDVYVKKPFFENNTIIRVSSKDENTDNTNNFEMIINDKLIQSKSRTNLKK